MMMMMIAKHRREKKERKERKKRKFSNFFLLTFFELLSSFLCFCSRYEQHFQRRRATVFIITDDDVSS